MRSVRKRRPCSTSTLRCRSSVAAGELFRRTVHPGPRGRPVDCRQRPRRHGRGRQRSRALCAGAGRRASGRASRRLRLPDGTFCEVRDLEQLDALLQAAGHRDGWVDRMQRHLQLVLVSCVVFVLVIAAAYKWGLPIAAEVGARHLPPAVSQALTSQTLRVLDGTWLKESKISAERQAALTYQFHALRLPDGGTPNSELLFRRSRQLGSNAFTLPDGTIILLDDLVKSMKDDRQIVAVLSHEWVMPTPITACSCYCRALPWAHSCLYTSATSAPCSQPHPLPSYRPNTRRSSSRRRTTTVLR